MSRAFRRFRLVLALVLALPAGLRAHNAPGSAVALDFHPDRIEAELTLPLVELELAFHQPLTVDPALAVPRHETALRAYLLEHIRATAPDGRPWTVEVPGPLTLQLETPPYDLRATVRLRPPAGAPSRRLELRYDVIGHEVNNHYANVVVRRDWDTAVFETPEPIGFLQYENKNLAIDRTRGGWWIGFHALLRLGMRHIAEGTDHLLFLLVLLLPAPLLPAARRWGAYGGWRRALSELAKIITAFTLGHSLTLLCGAVGWLRLPSQPVEILIAASILIAAVHAARPLFPRRELYVAAGFGLVHGLAFASTLVGLGLSSTHLVLALLAFNLGIEIMQLAVVVAVAAPLLLAARGRHYAPLRVSGALAAGIAAAAWLHQRATGSANAITGLLEKIPTHASLLLVVLLVASLLLVLLDRARPTVSNSNR